MEYSGARGKLIHEKNQKQKISWHCPFNFWKDLTESSCWHSDPDCITDIRRIQVRNFAFSSIKRFIVLFSVADPNPDLDPPDPHVFGPPGSGSGSISQRYGSRSGSGSFYHQAKKVRKTLIPTSLWLLFDFLSLEMMFIYLQKVISKKTFF